MKLLPAKYSGKCRDCGCRIDVGVSAWYDRYGARGHKLQCVACHDKEGPKEEPPKEDEDDDTSPADGLSVDWHALPKLGNYLHARIESTTEAARIVPSAKNAAFLKEVTTKGANCIPGGKTVTEWYGVKGGHKQVSRLTREGWPEGAARVMELRDRLSVSAPAAHVQRRGRRWSDQGDALDIHRVYAGRLDAAWQRTCRIERIAPVAVTLVVPLGGAWTLNADQLFWRGAATLVIADRLAAAGHPVEIVGVAATTSVCNGIDECAEIVIKHRHAPLDLSSIATVVCLSGWSRTVKFRISGSHEEVVSGHMGFSQEVPSELVALIARRDACRAIVIPRDVLSESDAAQCVETIIQSIDGADARAAA